MVADQPIESPVHRKVGGRPDGGIADFRPPLSDEANQHGRQAAVPPD
jgi:hypothetical protein